METVKIVNSVEYVKGAEVASFYGKNKHHAARFIRETFSEQDIFKFNATLFVKKSAVTLYEKNASQVHDKKTQQLEAKLLELERERLALVKAREKFEDSYAKCEKFRDEIYGIYLRKMRMMRMEGFILRALYEHVKGEVDPPFDEYTQKKFRQLKEYIDEEPHFPNP